MTHDDYYEQMTKQQNFKIFATDQNLEISLDNTQN